jgi:hypothetical protein
VGTVQAQAIMSLDGYVAKQDNTVGRLFDWLQNGDVAIPTPAGDFTFVTDGVESAIARAQELAGDRVVAVAGGTIARQCLDLGLLDEVAVDLVPVVMGDGNRPFFGELSSHDVVLGDPTVCIQGDRVIHLVFPVLR